MQCHCLGCSAATFEIIDLIFWYQPFRRRMPLWVIRSGIQPSCFVNSAISALLWGDALSHITVSGNHVKVLVFTNASAIFLDVNVSNFDILSELFFCTVSDGSRPGSKTFCASYKFELALTMKRSSSKTVQPATKHRRKENHIVKRRRPSFFHVTLQHSEHWKQYTI